MARVAPTVLEALRRFLPEHLASSPRLSADQRRAVRAITRCRTPALGGRAFACRDCSQTRFAWHSCNHKACPQCGRAATANGTMPYMLLDTWDVQQCMAECMHWYVPNVGIRA